VTTAELSNRILPRLDDDAASPGSVTVDPAGPVPFEILAAIAEGQELACWMTLCLETTVAVTLTASNTFWLMRALLPDYLVPLRLVGSNGRIRPATLAELDALNPSWQGEAGDPERYVALGWNVFGVNPQPVDDTAIQFTYARSPAQPVYDSFLELPEAYQPALIDYAIYKVKLKEGGQGLQRGIVHLNRFLDEMTNLGDYVRAKSRAARYDVLPFELALFDRSRLVEKLIKGQKKINA
jgi:hypothetical protein